MYTIDERDRVTELDDVPLLGTVDPPVVFAGSDRDDVYVSYFVAPADMQWEQFRDKSPGEPEQQPIGIVRFNRVRVHYLGAPNDEALHGHPLYERGLSFYKMHEVSDSSWIRSMERMTSVHRLHDPQRYLEGLRHFIMFRECVFECVAYGYHSQIIFGTRLESVDKMWERIRPAWI